MTVSVIVVRVVVVNDAVARPVPDTTIWVFGVATVTDFRGGMINGRKEREVGTIILLIM